MIEEIPMDRRFFIQTLNSVAIGSVLIGSAMADVTPSEVPIRSDLANFPLAFIQLSRCITNSVATKDCITGIDCEDFRRLILGKTGHCTFGYGAANGINGAVDAANLAINHPRVGIGRLHRAAAALVAIEVPSHGLFLRETRDIVLLVRHHLQAHADILYSSVSTMPLDSGDFRVSILASGIHQI